MNIGYDFIKATELLAYDLSPAFPEFYD